MRIYSNKKRPVKASNDGRKWVNTELTQDEYAKFRNFLKKKGYKYEASGAGDMVHIEAYLNEAEIEEADKFLDTLDSVNGACGKKSVKADSFLRHTRKSDDGTFSYTIDENKLYYGVPGAYFVWKGEWGDPWVEYDGGVYNASDLDSGVYSDFEEYCKENGITFSDWRDEDNAFGEWAKEYGRDSAEGWLYDMSPFAKVIETSGDYRWAKEIGVNASTHTGIGASEDKHDPKFRVDIYQRNNPDALITREYKRFKTEDEAKNYGRSISKGNEVVVNKVNESTRRRPVKASRNRKRKPIMAAEGSYEANMQKIQYYAQKVVADIKSAAEIFDKAGESWTPIEIPDVNGDDLFYEWYYTDYIQNFDDTHSKDEEIYELRGRNVEYAVRYGYFDSNDLENYGDDEAALYDFIQSFNHMEDIYYVTTEFGHTVADLANDPYAVFDDVFGEDESDKLYYSEEVLAEFDLLTSSDRVYDLAKDAQGIVNLYNEVSDYFSYTNAEQLLAEYNSENDGIKSSTSSASRVAIKASAEYTSPNADVIAVLEDNGFEYSNEPTPWWDKYMWLGFGATYNDETEQAYVWWNPNGNAYELPFNYSVETVSDANAMCDDLYTWDEYDIAELLNAGLPLIGATPYNNKLDEWEYDNGMGDKAYINTDLGNGYVIDVYGEKTEYSNLQDLLEAASIIR